MNGIILLLVACVCQGSFGIGMKTYQPYRWENFRVPFTVAGMLLYPLLILTICLPEFGSSLFANPKVFWVAFVCGVIWGVGAIFFDMAIMEVGIALTYGVNFGISATLGSLLALPFTGDKISTPAFILLLISTVVIVVGIVVITRAGFIEQEAKESAIGKENKTSVMKQRKGIIYGILAGLGSAAMNVGFTYATPIGRMAVQNADEITVVICERLVCWMPIFLGDVFPAYFIADICSYAIKALACI